MLWCAVTHGPQTEIGCVQTVAIVPGPGQMWVQPGVWIGQFGPGVWQPINCVQTVAAPEGPTWHGGQRVNGCVQVVAQMWTEFMFAWFPCAGAAIAIACGGGQMVNGCVQVVAQT